MARSRSQMRAREQAGLTLVEVLVALAILGLVTASIIGLITQNTRLLSSTEDRLVAGILVDNEMTEFLARAQPLELGDKTREAELGGRAWLVESHVIDAGVKGVVRIEISVRDAQRKQVAATATTLKMQGGG